VTEPRDRAPDDDLDTPEPIDDVEEEADRDGEPIDDADIDDIEDELADEAEEADEAEDAAETEVDDYEAAVREVSGEAPPVAPVARPSAAERRAAAAATTKTRAPSPSEVAVHVKENVSKYFVIATVVVFSLILLNGLLLGTGGLLRPLPTPTPEPTPSPSASGSPSASPAASPSPASS
jgi:hypothetical protein